MTIPAVVTVETDGGAGQEVDPKATARSLVAAAIKKAGVGPVPPVVVPPDEPVAPGVTPPVTEIAPETPPVVIPPVSVAPPDPTDPAAPAAGDVPPVDLTAAPEVVTQEDAAAVAAESGVSYAEAVERLQSLGIGVEHEDVPTELQDRYGALLKSTVDAVQPIFDQQETARAEIESVANFKTRMAERPESMLLMLWRAHPEVFTKVAEIAQQASDDPEYKARVMREIEVEARENKVDARESRFVQQQMSEKGRRTEALTRSAAVRHGVSLDVADKYVAAAVATTGAEAFDVATVDSIVSQLRPTTPAPVVPSVVTPVQAAAIQDAPTAPVSSDSPPAPGVSSGLDATTKRFGRGGVFGNLVRAAGARVDALKG